MKNKYNLSQIADIYCKELGVNIPCMEDYLQAIFQDKPIDKYLIDIERLLEADYDGNSEFFPEYKKTPPSQS
jgi:hypothetical protein